MIVHLYALCWNEADMLPFFFRHYDTWIDRYVIYDDDSDDGSLELLRAHPKVEIRRFERSVPGAFALSQRDLQNTAWKESRNVADWVVITALDEHLFVRGQAMRDYLEAQRQAGVTYIPAYGFDTISDALPAGDVRLVDAVTCGIPLAGFNKLSLFNPDAIAATGFTAGRHTAVPRGRLRLPRRLDLLLFHFKYVGYERTRDRQRAEGERLGPVDIRKRHGAHYLWSEERFRRRWERMWQTGIDMQALPDDPAEAAEAPFWWTWRGKLRLFMDRVRRRLGLGGPSNG